MTDLRTLAHALGGEVSGRASVLAPGPGHSRRDRSLSIKLDAAAPDGFLVYSYAGDDFAECRDHVRRLLGIERPGSAPRRATEGHKPALTPPQDEDREDKIAAALALWHGSVAPQGTLAETYLRSRGLDLDDDIAGPVLRWHPGAHAMVALFRNIHSDEPQAVSRAFLNREGRKVARKFLGPVGGGAIKLDANENVLAGLHIGEGVETCLAARQIGLKPTWALGSAGAIATFPVLNGIEALSLLREHDEANARAADAATVRWQAAGRELFDVWPNNGKDVNDAIRGGDA